MWNQYDIIVSDANFSTPLQSNYFYRNYIHVNEGNVKIRIIPLMKNQNLMDILNPIYSNMFPSVIYGRKDGNQIF